MNKSIKIYILATSCIFISTIVMNIRETQNLLNLFHLYNIVLAAFAIAGLYLYISIVKNEK